MSSSSTPDFAQRRPTDQLDKVAIALAQRELLEPGLLLSAGYMGVPFLLRQVFLLLAPVLALLGFAPHQAEDQHGLPQ